jgi:uncharacterized membrane protein
MIIKKYIHILYPQSPLQMTKMANTLYDIGLVSATMLLLDIIFLYLNSDLFIKQVISVQRTELKIRWESALACYIFLILGLYYFIIRDGRSIQDAFLLGIVIYGVYETTTFSILKNWRLQTVLQDTLWGGILFAATTWIVYKLK